MPEQMITFDEGLILFVHVISASDVRSSNCNGLSDPFVQLRLNDQKAETSVIRKTFVPVSKVSKGGKLRLVLQLVSPTTPPFVGPADPQPPAPPSEVLEIQVHLIEADSLPNMDTLGSADPSCVLPLFSRPQSPSVKSSLLPLD
jgi:hypothetical protein